MAQKEQQTEAEPVGKSTLDAEHEMLHEILDELKQELGAGGDRVEELLEQFDMAARAHFLEEQSLMRLHAYPGYEPHQNEHDDLIEELRRLTARIDEGEAADAAHLTQELDDWLTVHMNTTDAAMEEYLRREGIRPGIPN